MIFLITFYAQQVKNKIVREVIDFVKENQLLFDQVLHENLFEADELIMEQINLVVGILSKVSAVSEYFGLNGLGVSICYLILLPTLSSYHTDKENARTF